MIAVAHGRAVRAGLPAGALQIASDSADMTVLMNFVSIERNRSDEAEARC